MTHAEPLHIAAAAGTSSVLAWITVVLRSNYLNLKAIGPAASPTILLAGPCNGSSTRLAQRRFLQDLPQRKEPKARAAPFAIPQRQKAAGTGLEMICLSPTV